MTRRDIVFLDDVINDFCDGRKSVNYVCFVYDYFQAVSSGTWPRKEEILGLLSPHLNKRLGLLARIRSCLTLKAVKCVYNTLIEPILSYTDTAWGELSVASSKSLQRLQNRAARIILKSDSSRDTFNVLGWTDLETNRKIHKCVLVFKCLHNLVPQYLSNYFIRNYNVHGYNTDLHLPKPKLSLGKRTFRFSGTALFNSLPCKIQQAVSLSSFKNLVKAHFIYST